MILIILSLLCVFCACPPLLGASLTVVLRLAFYFFGRYWLFRNCVPTKTQFDEDDESISLSFATMTNGMKVNWRGLIFPISLLSHRNKEKLKAQNAYPFIHFPLPVQNTKAFIFINELNICSISSIFKILFHSPCNLRFEEICLNFSINIRNQNGSTISSTNFDLKIGSINASINVYNLWIIAIVTPIIHRIKKFLSFGGKQRTQPTDDKGEIHDAKVNYLLEAIPNLLNNISIEKFALNIEVEQHLLKTTDDSEFLPSKYSNVVKPFRGNVCLSFNKISCQMMIPEPNFYPPPYRPKEQSLMPKNKMDFGNNKYAKITETIFNMKLFVDRLIIQAESDVKPNENINNENRFQLEGDPCSNPPTFQLPTLLVDIKINNEISKPTIPLNKSLPLFQTNRDKIRTINIRINAHDARISQGNNKVDNDSFQLSCGLQELVNVAISFQSYHIMLLSLLNLFDKNKDDVLWNVKKNKIKSVQKHRTLVDHGEDQAQVKRQKSSEKHIALIEKKKKKSSFFIDKLSVEMGFIISIYDNMTDFSDNHVRTSFDSFYSARDLMVDENAEISNKKNVSTSYPILELCANGINATFSINKGKNEKDSKLGHLIIVDIPIHDIFLTLDDNGNDANERIDLIHIENPKLNCIIEKAHENTLDICFDAHNVMGMVDINKMETILKIVYVFKNTSFNKDQRGKGRKIRPNGSDRDSDTNRSVIIKNSKITMESVDLFLINVFDKKNDSASLIVTPPASSMLHVQLLHSSMSKTLNNSLMSQQNKEHIQISKLVITLCMSLSSEVLKAIQTPSLTRNLLNKTRTTSFFANVHDINLSWTKSQNHLDMKTSYQSISTGKILLHEYRYRYIAINRISLRTLTSFLQMEYENESKVQKFQPCIVSNGFDASFSPCVNHVYSSRRNILVNPTEIVWSPIFHLSIMASLKSISFILDNFKDQIKKNTQNNDYVSQPHGNVQKSKKSSSCRVVTKFNKIFISVMIGASSNVDINTESIELDIGLNYPGLGTKPNISVLFENSIFTMNKFQPSFLVVDKIVFKDTFKLAPIKEVNSYKAKIREREGISKFDDTIQKNVDGCPLMEEIDFHFGNLAVNLGPDLYFGRVLDDILLTPKVLDEALLICGYVKQKKRRIYQLMTIKSSIVNLDISFLDYNNPSIQSNARIPVSIELKELKHSESGKDGPMKDATDSLVKVFRLVADGIDVKIDRSMPPSATHHCLTELDKDPNNKIMYGPEIKGGFMNLKIAHLVAILDPLNLVTPLAVIEHFQWRGLLFLTELSPETPNLKPGHHFYVPLSCSHKTCRQKFFSKNINETKTICNYHIQTHSRGIPTKFYMDGVIKTNKIHITFGPQVQASIPLLMSMIKRVLPPPPAYESSMNIPLAWWDNLRFVMHGKVRLTSELILFRWLLDTVDNSDWCILVKCKGFDLSYILSNLKLCLQDLYISLPNEPYITNLKQRKSVPLQKSSTIICSSHDRQPILFIPSFELGLAFDWAVASSNVFSPMAHHSPYMVTDTAPIHSEEANPLKKSSDKFYYFRSNGVTLKLKVVMTGSYKFSNWIVMRIEMLPWITHQYVSRNSPVMPNSIENINPDDPGPIPKIIRVLMDFEAEETKVALWHGALDTAGLCIKLPAIKFNFLASRKNATIEKFTHISTRIEIDGDTQGALLDVMNPDASDQAVQKKEQDNIEAETFEELILSLDDNPMQNNPVFEKTEIFDRVCGAFGAVENEFNFNFCDGKFGHEINKQSKNDNNHSHYFDMLETWMCNLSQVDYIVQATKIIIVDSHTPLEEYISIKDIFNFQSKEKMQSWAIFVSGMKLLWTLEIRDVILKLIGDHLLETINFMVVQLKGDTPVVTTDDMIDDDKEVEIDLSNRSDGEIDKMSSNIESSVNKKRRTSLMYLLQRASSRLNFKHERDISSENRNQFIPDDKLADEPNNSLPIVNIYLLNPQIQLHSQGTGGSIILAMKGAYVEGKSFIKLYVDNQSSTEITKNKMLRKVEFKYALDSVRGFSVSTNVDINIGLQWLDLVTEDHVHKRHKHTRNDTISNLTFILNQNSRLELGQTSNHGPSEFCVPNLFRQILDPFNFRARQLFFLPPNNLSENEIINYITRQMYIELNGPATDTLKVQIDELSFVLDGKQFSTTIDLIRNVLLAPLPSQIAKKKPNVSEEDANTMKSKQKQQSLWHDEAEQIEELILQYYKNSNSDFLHNKTSRNVLRAALKNLVNKIEVRNSEKGNDTVRCITWNLFKAKWKIRGQSYIDDVEIRFTNLQGMHEFSSIGSLESNFELEDLGAINSKPSPDSINFKDPTAVITTVLGDNRSPCQRCGKIFSQLDNEVGSCIFHADPYGVPGMFQMNSKTGKMQWTCCDSTDPNAKGCCSRPHTGIERALMIRVEAHPKVMDKMTLYKHFEINFFPSVNHMLSIQITKSIAELVMDYFVGVKNIDEDTLSTADSHRTESTISTDGMMSTNRSDLHRHDTLISSEITVDSNSEKKKNLLLGHTNRHRSSLSKTDKVSQFQSSSSSSKASKHVQQGGDLMQDVEAKEGSEIFFIKHWRIGHVNFELSFAGFHFIDTSNFVIAVNAFPRSYKIGHVPYLSQKYLTYLIQEVIFSATSSGLKKIFNDESLHNQAGDENASANADDIAKSNSAAKYSEKVNLLLGTPRKNRRSR